MSIVCLRVVLEGGFGGVIGFIGDVNTVDLTSTLATLREEAKLGTPSLTDKTI